MLITRSEMLIVSSEMLITRSEMLNASSPVRKSVQNLDTLRTAVLVTSFSESDVR